LSQRPPTLTVFELPEIQAHDTVVLGVPMYNSAYPRSSRTGSTRSPAPA